MPICRGHAALTMTEVRVSSDPREVIRFTERALADFGLLEAFESRCLEERLRCLRWIEAAAGSREEERRVTKTLDCLERGERLPGS